MKSAAKVLSALIVLTAGAASAQSVSKPDPLEQSARVPPVVYRSAMSDYRAYRDPKVVDWRDTNAGVGKLGGHVGHVAPSGCSEAGKPSCDSATPAPGCSPHPGQVRAR